MRFTSGWTAVRRAWVVGVGAGLVACAPQGEAPPVPVVSSAEVTLGPPRLVPKRAERVQRARFPGEAEGAVPTGVTVFDEYYPAVVKLDGELLRALREAAGDAAGEGVRFYVNSGWRSAKRQNELLNKAIATYGSRAEAARWVASPATSLHVAGEAVDLGRADATSWLSAHGDRYGLCQTYRNEPWHYELRPQAVAQGCPAPYADPTEDPRLTQ